MKNRIISLLLAVLMLVSVLAMTVSAAKTGDGSAETSEGSEGTRTEEVKWYYRNYYGHVQKRLWSVTFGCWLTDWINVD